jgi:hypothetical protein
MKHLKSMLILSMLLFNSTISANSFGTATGCLTTADACGFGNGYLGAFACYGDDAKVLFGNISYGFSKYTEGRLLFGLSDPDFDNTDPAFLFGADIKYEIMDYSDTQIQYPFDAAAGAFVEIVNYAKISTIQIGAFGIASIPYVFESGRQLIPYARLNIRWEKLNDKDNNDISDSNFRVGVNIGAKYELMKDLNIFLEAQLDGNRGILGGVNFRAL